MALNIGPAAIAPSPSVVPAQFLIRFTGATQGAPSAVATVVFELDPHAPVSFRFGNQTTKILQRASFVLTPVPQPVDTRIILIPDSGAVAHAIIPILLEVEELAPGNQIVSVARRFCTLIVP